MPPIVYMQHSEPGGRKKGFHPNVRPTGMPIHHCIPPVAGYYYRCTRVFAKNSLRILLPCRVPYRQINSGFIPFSY